MQKDYTSASTKKLLITAFEPFGGRARNASSEALRELLGALRHFPEIRLETRILPVQLGHAAKQLLMAIDSLRPDILICLGEAKRDAITLETSGYNERKFEIPDNAGNLIREGAIVPDGPPSYPATLRLERLFEAMSKTGVPVRLSDDPGRYLCNEVFYSALHHISVRQLPVQAVFIHIPHLPEAASEPDYPFLSTKDAVCALAAALTAMLETVRESGATY